MCNWALPWDVCLWSHDSDWTIDRFGVFPFNMVFLGSVLAVSRGSSGSALGCWDLLIW